MEIPRWKVHVQHGSKAADAWYPLSMVGSITPGALCLQGHDTIIHSLSVNDDDVLVSAGDDGSMRCVAVGVEVSALPCFNAACVVLRFWDYKTGYCFQNLQTAVQPGECPAAFGVCCIQYA